MDAKAGHRILPHTADLALEAWAPTRDQCLDEAVRALVETFATWDDAVAPDAVTCAIEPAGDENLLASVLDEVIYLVEVHRRVPTEVAEVTQVAGPVERVDVRFATVPADETTVVGAIPKAVALHQLRFGHADGGWRCQVTIDV